MAASLNQKAYIIISPVRDEEKYLERTIQSVTAQTLRPRLWVIVDDGSQDRSYEIASGYSQRVPWIRVVRIPRDGERNLGSAEVRAFMQGLEYVGSLGFDFVVKLDADLELPPEYFESLVGKFLQDGKLGIASGVYLEEGRNGWKPVWMPPYHASGASKVVRTECFRDIGGFALSRGWDTVDEIKAQFRGWKTCHFPELQFLHLRPEGKGIGSLRTGVLHGEAYYASGGGLLFFLLKFLHRLVAGEPLILGGLAMLWGFVSCLLSGRPRLVSCAEARYYRRALNRRVTNHVVRRIHGEPQQENTESILGGSASP